jgi:hypothetical protein
METQTPPSPPASAANPARDTAAAGSPATHQPAPHGSPTTAPAEDSKPTFRERVGDALRYLCTGRMPTMAIGGTLVFPLVLALGGILTAISDVFALRLIAVVPALFLLAMVGVACQHTLRCALRGLDEADDLPPPAEFARQSLRLLPHVAVLGAVFLGPGALMLRLGQWQSAFLLFPAGLLLLPMAGAQLLSTGDWRALSPALLWSAIRRGGRPYLDTVAAVAALAAPALLAFALTLGLPGYTLVSIVGPLGVVPSLMAARMMGILLEQERARFEGLFDVQAAGQAPPPAAPSRPAAAQPTQTKLVQTKPAQTKPAQPRPTQTRPTQPKSTQPRPTPPQPAQSKPAQAKPAQSNPSPAPRAASKPAPATPAQPKPVAAQPAKAPPAPTSAKPAATPSGKPAPAPRPAPKQ